MISRRKSWIIATSIAAIAALLLLSASLSEFKLLPGRPFLLAGEELSPSTSRAAPLGNLLVQVWNALGILLLVLLPFAIIQFIISPAARKRVIRTLFTLVLTYVLWYLLFRTGLRGFLEATQALGTINSAQAGEPLLVEFNNLPPDWLVLAITAGLILLLIATAWLVWRRGRVSSGPLPQVTRQAQQAIVDLQAGGDIKDVVTRCYVEMSRALSLQRGLLREVAMTPREFETRLQQAGLPGQQVQRLTRLFEGVRYGAKPPGEREQHEAIACLSAIVQAAGPVS